MDRPQSRRREHRLLVALPALDLVRHAELLEQPEHPLRARLVEMMDDDHRRLLSSGVTPSCVISSAAPAIVMPFRKNDVWMRRIWSSAAVIIATPWTVIVTGTRKTKISHPPRRA